LSAAALPPCADTDGLRALRPRVSKLLVPSSVRPTCVLLGVLDTFKGTFVAQALFCAGTAVAKLGSPIGINRLLAYIESGGTGAVVRPWVWIAWITLTPLLLNAFEQLYIYYNVRARLRSPHDCC
jgi:hypothetical protein